jgi:hypothetical protein
MEWSSQKDWSSRSLPSWPSPLILHGLKKCWLMDWFHINISTMFVAATFRLRHVHSGICRSGYRLWFVILFRNHSIRILLVFNFTPLSNFSLSLFQTKVFIRRITLMIANTPHPSPLPFKGRGSSIRCHSAYSQRKFLSDRSSIVSKWIPLWNLNGISSIAKIIDKPFLIQPYSFQ